MPIYEYTCQDCSRAFETLVRSDSTPCCPACGSASLDKKLSVFATSATDGGAEPMPPGGCGRCGHPDGPGACGLN